MIQYSCASVSRRSMAAQGGGVADASPYLGSIFPVVILVGLPQERRLIAARVAALVREPLLVRAGGGLRAGAADGTASNPWVHLHVSSGGEGTRTPNPLLANNLRCGRRRPSLLSICRWRPRTATLGRSRCCTSLLYSQAIEGWCAGLRLGWR